MFRRGAAATWRTLRVCAGVIAGHGVLAAMIGPAVSATKTTTSAPNVVALSTGYDTETRALRPLLSRRSMRIEMLLRVLKTPGAASAVCGHAVTSAIFARHRAYGRTLCVVVTT